MKAKFEVGASIDFLTKDEMTEVMAAWWAEVGRGVRFRRFNGQATVAGGVWSMLIPGPREDCIWAVTRLAASGPGLVLGTDIWTVAVNQADPSTIVGTGFLRNATWDVGVLMLNGGDQLAVNGVGTGAGAVAISGAAIELPNQLAWQFL